MTHEESAATDRRDGTPADYYRMRKALRMLGWSAHSGSPRFGPKAQLARWALGQDERPADLRGRSA
jgi:hypothetical protein